MMLFTAGGWCYRLVCSRFIFPWWASTTGRCVDRCRVMRSAIPINLVMNIIIIILRCCHSYLRKDIYITPLTSTGTEEYLVCFQSLPLGCWRLSFLQQRVEDNYSRIFYPISSIFFRQNTHFFIDLPKVIQFQLWTKYFGLSKKSEICNLHGDISEVGHDFKVLSTHSWLVDICALAWPLNISPPLNI